MDLLLAALAPLAFAPALGYAFWLRNQEDHGREPLGPVLTVFLYGATVGVAAALMAGLVARGALQGAEILPGVAVSVVLMAPLLEEASKAFGLPLARRHMDEVEDGIVYGTAIGVGFAATETVLYAQAALAGGDAWLALQTVLVRSFSSLLLHAGTSALVGFGYGMARALGRSRWTVLPYLAAAIGIHGTYNLFVALDPMLGLAANLLVVLGLGLGLRLRLRELDRRGATPFAQQATA